jgi:hypothetical protein
MVNWEYEILVSCGIFEEEFKPSTISSSSLQWALGHDQTALN